MQPFSILIGIGTMAGLLLMVWRTPQKQRLRYLDAAILAMLGGLLVSRMVAVGADWAYYQAHIGEIFQVWKGGLSGIGALMGGILMILLISAAWKIPVGSLGDVLLPLVGTITIAAWMGCWIGGCSYGATTNTWWAIPVRDEWGVISSRIPVQLIGATLTLVILWLLEWSSKYFPVRGLATALGIFGLSAIVFGLSYLRSDPMPIWNGLRLDAWGALGLLVFAALVVVVLLSWWLLKKKSNHLGRNP